MISPDDDDGLSRRLTVLYGSQTGNAEDVANRIAREARRRHWIARSLAMDDYDKSEVLEEQWIIFVAATSGQGQEPSNMRSFWQFLLRSDLPAQLLDQLRFTVFGLGDSSYSKYNWPARKLWNRLLMLGAVPFHEKGEADDQHYAGIEGTLDPWLEDLWRTLDALMPMPAHLNLIPSTAMPSARVSLSSAKQSTLSDVVSSSQDLVWATVSRNERATAPDHFQDTRYFDLTLDDATQWRAGDVLELKPKNIQKDVDMFLKHVRWADQADQPLRIESASQDQPLPPYWPAIATVRQICRELLDIFAVPRRSFFEMLAYFAKSDLEAERLREFCMPANQDELWDYSTRPRRTITEVLSEFKSVEIPLAYIFDVFPEIKPRQFSIASSSLVDPKRVQLLVAIVDYKTILHLPRRGVCTHWLKTLQPGTRLQVKIMPGSLETPKEINTPIICVGPGTGIAPFRALAQERAAQTEQTDLTIFFGCRSLEKDFYHAQEWQKAHDAGRLKFIVAASRDTPDKVYVQHKLREEAVWLWQLLRQGAHVYISGSAGQMPKSVRKALIEIIETQSHVSRMEAQAYLDTMEADGRLQEETWS